MAEWLQSISEWFWPRFDPNKCKLYLKSAVVRMNLKKKKGQEQVKQMEKEIGDLAKQEKEDLARLRIEQLVRDKRMLEAYDMLELMCEIVVSRLQLINMYPAVPEDLVEPVYTLTWASLRLAIPEFKHLAFQFKLKYGEEWVQDALNNTSHYVNQELIERLSVCCADQDTVEEEMCRISPVPAHSSSFELAAFDGDPGAASPSYLSAFSPATAGPGAPPQAWAYTSYPTGGPAPVAAQQSQMPLGPPAPYLGQPQQQPQQPYQQQQQTQQYVQQQPYQQQPPTVYFPGPATTSPALPPSMPPSMPPPAQGVSAAPAGSAPSPVLQPFVLPELDFGDWSSPLGTTQGLAFPHVASTSAVPTPSPLPSSSSSALSTTSSSPSLTPSSSTSTITTTSTTSAMAPTTSPAQHEVDPSLMFPAIPSDNPDPAKTTSALPPPAAVGGDDAGAAPGGATDEEEFDELSARFEALKKGL